MIEIIVLSVVQGITEFIPVSSSQHLLIFGELFQNSGKLNLLIFTSMHLGSLFGVATFLLTDTKMEIKKVHLKQLFFLILFGTIPSVLIGFFQYDFVSENLTIKNKNIQKSTYVQIKWLKEYLVCYVSLRCAFAKKLNCQYGRENQFY